MKSILYPNRDRLCMPVCLRNTVRITSVLLLFLLSAQGCKKVTEEAGLVGVCPVVVSTSPAASATGINPSTRITATFNEVMDPATITSETFMLMQGTTPIAGVISYAGTTATFSPTASLAPNTVYTATVTNGVRDPMRNAMISNYVWSFTTGAGPDILRPTVTSTDPANASTGAALNQKITIVFSETMDSASTVNSVSLANTTAGGTAVAGTVAYNGTNVVFTPSANLSPNATYTGTVSTGARDLAGNTLAGNYVFNFTTGASADNTPPTVASTVPANGATGVPSNTRVTATFSEAMDPASINSGSFTLTQGAVPVAGAVSYSSGTATFSPAAPLAPGTTYTATITTGARDLAGNPMAANSTWTFATGTATDATAPTVISTVPASNATGVPSNTRVTATFSEPVDPATITPSTFFLRAGSASVPGTLSYAGNTATFTPSATLVPNTAYTATVTTGVRDLAGNPMAANYVWNFTTGTAADVVPPTIVSILPSGTNCVAANSSVTTNFSEIMDPTTLSLAVRAGANTVDGTVTITGNSITFTPSASLAPGVTYTGTVAVGARDLAGNLLNGTNTFTFTTCVTLPSLGSAATFGSYGGTTGMVNQGVNTVVNGNIGTTAPSLLVTGFHDGTTGDVYTETPANIGLVTGRIYTAIPAPGTVGSTTIAALALADATLVYTAISPVNRPFATDPGNELGGQTLPPGVYRPALPGNLLITTGNLVLDGRGDPNAAWIFQAPTGLTVGTAGTPRSITLINGAQARNVYWYSGTGAIINSAGGGVMVGTILTTTGVIISSPGNTVQTVLNGRAISIVGAVSMTNTTINVQ